MKENSEGHADASHPYEELLRAIEKLGVHDHLCLIYEIPEEQFAAVFHSYV